MKDPELEDAEEDEEFEAAITHADHAFGAESFGTTAEEELEGGSLERRLAEERPDRPTVDWELSIVDEGLSDDEDELVGEAVTQRDPFASPEETAVTVRDRAPGATDHEEPHTLDEE